MIKLFKATFIIAVISIIGCTPFKSNIDNELQSKYIWSPFYGVAEVLQLNSDHTFSFKWQQGLIQGVTEGTYIINKNGLTLNSLKQPIKTEKFRIDNRQNNQNITGYHIRVKDEYDAPFEYTNCAFIQNDSVIGGTTSKKDGVIIISESQKDNFEKIEISFVGYNHAVIDLHKTPYNSFEIILLPESEYYEFFTKEFLKIRGNKIYRFHVSSDGKHKRKIYKKAK
ncbi:hypothetical protein MHTCC0001_21310 [Flavobacteriaceae bacterium MHTCC 0001]